MARVTMLEQIVKTLGSTTQNECVRPYQQAASLCRSVLLSNSGRILIGKSAPFSQKFDTSMSCNPLICL